MLIALWWKLTGGDATVPDDTMLKKKKDTIVHPFTLK